MDTSGSELHPVQRLADEFLERQRRGEHPMLEEYAERYPELADEIREVFPALVMIDQIAPAVDDLEESRDARMQPEVIRQKQIGDYRILREIGRGGMGVVYEAEQESLRPYGRVRAVNLIDAPSIEIIGGIPATEYRCLFSSVPVVYQRVIHGTGWPTARQRSVAAS